MEYKYVVRVVDGEEVGSVLEWQARAGAGGDKRGDKRGDKGAGCGRAWQVALGLCSSGRRALCRARSWGQRRALGTASCGL